MNSNKLKLIVAIILLCINSSSVNAQVVPPANFDAGAIDGANTRRINESKLINNTVREKNSNKSDIKPVESPKSHLKSAFMLKKVIFTGNTIFSAEYLMKNISELVGRNVTLEDLSELTKKITMIYHNKGYITSIAYIPPQKIRDGVLEIAIIEGKVANIKINGNKWTKEAYIKNSIFKSNKINENKIFNVNNYTRAVNTLEDTDYLKGQVEVIRGEQTGTSDIILSLNERLPLDFNAGWDNSGKQYIGYQRANLITGIENLTGFGDSIYSSVILASSTIGSNTEYKIPISRFGTQVKLGYSYFDAALKKEYEVLDIKSSSHNFNIGLIQPTFRNDHFNIESDLNFDIRTEKTTSAKGAGINSNYEIRALRTGILLTEDDSTGRWIARNEISVGLPILGASHKTPEGSGKFFKLNPSLIRVQRLPFNSLLIGRIQGQYSPNNLLGAEELQAGGMYSVRGFSDGIASGDNGLLSSLEFRKNIPFIPDTLYIPFRKSSIIVVPLKDKLQYALFYDFGYIKEHYDKYNLIQSLGMGLRIYLSKKLNANLDWGIPVNTDNQHLNHGFKFHFSLSSDVF